METNLYRLGKERWNQTDSYHKEWDERNGKLISLLEHSGVNIDEFSFSEYGCGPNKPFSKLLKRDLDLKTLALDLKKWDDYTISIDLDKTSEQAPLSTVGVLSGVMEYLKSPSDTLTILSKKHEYLLLSYRIFQFKSDSSIESYSKALSDRAKKGWKNHMSLEACLSCINSFGFIVQSDVWQKQSLFLLKSWNSED